MKLYRLQNMKGGWFVGDFLPTCYTLEECEVACKHYRKGDAEGRHIHKVANEITLIASGHVAMNGVEYRTGDIVLLEPGDDTDFAVLEDTITVVVKIPSVAGDKYPV